MWPRLSQDFHEVEKARKGGGCKHLVVARVLLCIYTWRACCSCHKRV
jgi:hypothetical protein